MPAKKNHELSAEIYRKHRNSILNLENMEGKSSNMRTRLTRHLWLTQFDYPKGFNTAMLAIYGYMMGFMTGHNIETTHDVIGRYASCSVRTVQTAIKNLELLGLIKRLRKGNNLTKKRSLYQLLEYEEGKAIRQKNENKIQKWKIAEGMEG